MDDHAGVAANLGQLGRRHLGGDHVAERGTVTNGRELVGISDEEDANAHRSPDFQILKHRGANHAGLVHDERRHLRVPPLLEAHVRAGRRRVVENRVERRGGAPGAVSEAKRRLPCHRAERGVREPRDDLFEEDRLPCARRPREREEGTLALGAPRGDLPERHLLHLIPREIELRRRGEITGEGIGTLRVAFSARITRSLERVDDRFALILLKIYDVKDPLKVFRIACRDVPDRFAGILPDGNIIFVNEVHR